VTDYDEAEEAAFQHRNRYGDDVILHCPEDMGTFFACEDCGWVYVYDPASNRGGEAVTND